MDSLVTKTEQWFYDRNLQSLNGEGQLTKLDEEVQELHEAFDADNRHDEMDAVGDVMVVLIGYCLQRGIDIKECLAMAYDNIKDRKGKVVDGVFVKEQQDNITVYSQPKCIFCDRVKKLLDSKGLSYEEIDLKDESNHKLLDWLRTQVDGKLTTPQVYINGERIGGYIETKEYFKKELE